MDKKELLKRWALAYTEPSLFYVPWKKEPSMYVVRFIRYSTIVGVRYGFVDSGIESQVYGSPLFYVYDSQGNYYDNIGGKHQEEYPLHSMSMNLPNGTYYYKEMKSLIGCKLIKDVICFKIQGANIDIELHYKPNLIHIEYNIVPYTWIISYLEGFYTVDDEVDRGRQISYLDYIFDVQHLGTIDSPYTRHREFDIPIIQITRAFIEGSDKDIDIQIETKVTKTVFDSDNNRPDLTVNKVIYQGEYYSFEPSDATYIASGTYAHKEIYENTSYVYKYKGIEYQLNQDYMGYTYGHFVAFAPSGDNYINYSYIHTRRNEIYAEYISGFDGEMPPEYNWGDKSVTIKRIDSTPYKKYIHGSEYKVVNNKYIFAGTITEKEQEASIETYEKYYENFNEVFIFSEILNTIAVEEKITILSPMIYKMRNGKRSCYFARFMDTQHFEKRFLVYGEEVTNTEADHIFVGALIAYEEREEQAGGET